MKIGDSHSCFCLNLQIATIPDGCQGVEDAAVAVHPDSRSPSRPEQDVPLGANPVVHRAGDAGLTTEEDIQSGMVPGLEAGASHVCTWLMPDGKIERTLSLWRWLHSQFSVFGTDPRRCTKIGSS